MPYLLVRPLFPLESSDEREAVEDRTLAAACLSEAIPSPKGKQTRLAQPIFGWQMTR